MSAMTFAEAIDDLFAAILRGEKMPIRKRVTPSMLWEYVGVGWTIEERDPDGNYFLIWTKAENPP